MNIALDRVSNLPVENGFSLLMRMVQHTFQTWINWSPLWISWYRWAMSRGKGMLSWSAQERTWKMMRSLNAVFLGKLLPHHWIRLHVHTSFFGRTFLMHGFHFLVWLFAVRGIRDTQCGFKLFSRSAASTLFAMMHVERWAFDVELLFVAQYFRMPIAEIAVKWTEIDGSKVTPIWSWLQMGRDLFLIWFRYAIGAWSLQRVHSNKKIS